MILWQNSVCDNDTADTVFRILYCLLVSPCWAHRSMARQSNQNAIKLHWFSFTSDCRRCLAWPSAGAHGHRNEWEEFCQIDRWYQMFLAICYSSTKCSLDGRASANMIQCLLYLIPWDPNLWLKLSFTSFDLRYRLQTINRVHRSAATCRGEEKESSGRSSPAAAHRRRYDAGQPAMRCVSLAAQVFTQW